MGFSIPNDPRRERVTPNLDDLITHLSETYGDWELIDLVIQVEKIIFLKWMDGMRPNPNPNTMKSLLDVQLTVSKGRVSGRRYTRTPGGDDVEATLGHKVNEIRWRLYTGALLDQDYGVAPSFCIRQWYLGRTTSDCYDRSSATPTKPWNATAPRTSANVPTAYMYVCATHGLRNRLQPSAWPRVLTPHRRETEPGSGSMIFLLQIIRTIIIQTITKKNYIDYSGAR